MHDKDEWHERSESWHWTWRWKNTYKKYPKTERCMIKNPLCAFLKRVGPKKHLWLSINMHCCLSTARTLAIVLWQYRHPTKVFYDSSQNATFYVRKLLSRAFIFQIQTYALNFSVLLTQLLNLWSHILKWKSIIETHFSYFYCYF